MLVKVCLLLLSVGVYASYAGSSSAPTHEYEMFDELDFVFPEHFLKKFQAEGQFFSLKIFVYLFFNIFAKYFAENEPVKFWSKFNRDDFNRVAMDALFYEYLTKFADRKLKNLVYDPLKRSKRSAEDIAIDRIGEYLDKLSEDEVPSQQPETQRQATKIKDFGHRDAKCAMVSLPTPISGIEGKDFPNYCDIPKTHFSCRNKLVPGIYADIETGCQVFHVCWPDRMDSFLCPIGATFNQELLTCDFWHESDCSSAPLFFIPSRFFAGQVQRNAEPTTTMSYETQATLESSSVFAPELEIPEFDGKCQSLVGESIGLTMKFLPAKCKVTHLKPSSQKTKGPIESNEHFITELPFDELPPVDSGFEESWQEKTKHSRPATKNVHLKPNKMSEDSKRQLLEMMMRTLELGANVLSDGVLPLMERVILNSPKKVTKSKKHSPTVDFQ